MKIAAEANQAVLNQTPPVAAAGRHLIIELWQAKHLSDLCEIEIIMRQAVAAAGAEILNLDLHKFSGAGGVSGVAILRESHLSIHTWPEYGYAAMDIFVCGKADPYKAVAVLKERFAPEEVQVQEIKRGLQRRV